MDIACHTAVLAIVGNVLNSSECHVICRSVRHADISFPSVTSFVLFPFTCKAVAFPSSYFQTDPRVSLPALAGPVRLIEQPPHTMKIVKQLETYTPTSMASTTPVKKKPTTFLSLPPELRNHIYSLSHCLELRPCAGCTRYLQRGTDNKAYCDALWKCLSHLDQLYGIDDMHDDCEYCARYLGEDVDVNADDGRRPCEHCTRYPPGGSDDSTTPNTCRRCTEVYPTHCEYCSHCQLCTYRCQGFLSSKYGKQVKPKSLAVSLWVNRSSYFAEEGYESVNAKGNLTKLRATVPNHSKSTRTCTAWTHGTHHASRVAQPELTKVSQQVRRETLSVFYGIHSFLFTLMDVGIDGVNIRNWLRTIGKENAARLENVKVVYRNKTQGKFVEKELLPAMATLGVRKDEGVVTVKRLPYPYCYCESCIRKAVGEQL